MKGSGVLKNKFFVVIMSLVIAAASMAGAKVSLAEGEGTGGGQDAILTLEQATVKDGDKDVELDRRIVFTFNKNVVNISVKENNEKCFSVVDEKGEPVSFSIIMADDQLEREKRNDIEIEIADGLKEGKQYNVGISKNLTSKSGDVLDKDYEYSFSTINYAAEGDNKEQADETKSEQVSIQSSDDNSKASGASNSNRPLLIGIGVIVAVAALVLVRKFGKKS